MAKRFTDTDIWNKEWFMVLTVKEKCLIRYLFDRCDVAGIWDANWPLASLYIGEKVSEKDLDVFGDRIKKLSATKFFICDFIGFQYGELSEKSKPHIKVISILKKYGLYETEKDENFIGYTKGIETVEEEDKDTDKEKEKEKEEGGVGETKVRMIPSVAPFTPNDLEPAKVYLQGHSMFSLIQKNYQKTGAEALTLFENFFETKSAFGEMKHKNRDDLMNNFYYWVPKYLKSAASNQPQPKTAKGLEVAANLQHVKRWNRQHN